MIANTYFNVLNQQVSQLPIQVDQVEGYFKGAANQWLQLHDSCVTPATGAVPIWEVLLSATAQFFENLQVAHLNLTEGVFIGVSTTEGTWTAATGANTMDITVWTDTNVIATNIVGDKTTQQSSLQVWTEATGAGGQKKLYRLIVQNQNASPSTVYALTYAQIPPSDYGNYQSIATVGSNAGGNFFQTESFGDGLTPQSVTLVQGTGATLHLGCKVFISDSIPTTGGSLTLNANTTILAVTN